MSGSWLTALPSLAMALLVVVVPGTVVRMAGWRLTEVTAWFFVPAMSVAVVATAANVAHFVHLPWSGLPVALVTLVVAAVAFFVRRLVPRAEQPHIGLGGGIAISAALVTAAVAIALQTVAAFGQAGAISQTLDNIVHLNAIRLATDTADASAIQIGATSDIPFYPNGWHSLVVLVELITGAPIPVAVNSVNVVVAAVVWPASCAALAWVIFRRPFAVVVAALLSTGFGAFPLLLLDFGVLYPNFTGYALVGSALAAVWGLARPHVSTERLRTALLLCLLCVGVGLAHPNALLAVYALGAPAALALIVPLARTSSRRGRIALTGLGIAVVVVGIVAWTIARTNYDMSRWTPWQTASQALGEALTVAPRQFAMTIVIAVLLAVGAFTLVRHPSRVAIAVPFAAAVVLFVLASGTNVTNPLREALTNPWYNDPYRLAALLPIAAIPLLVQGALSLTAGVQQIGERVAGSRAWIRPTAIALVVIAAASVAVGPNIRATIVQTRAQYVLADDANLLSEDEDALLSRLDETTPPDAVIIGSPLTGASLAYALADRTVTERHVFGARTQDEQYLAEHLKDISSDPRVCEAVRSVGVTYALEFGDRTVNDNDGDAYRGLVGLEPSDKLVLIDSEGPDAKLFKIEGC
ncbi:DUF6541 family protein [Microbacterium testaceum]|uniref:DUF6541 family protein n=1 Tax=Microbacterium testaceum TaxID=2033 RepID=UPI001D17CCAB|nr:DUF6541 family protein [Microbacterium testaceum]MCC4249280.1 hypothetical protein [Microbacterium testaceum]